MTPPLDDNSRELPDEVLDRFVADECPAAEAVAVRRWIAADPSPPARQQKVARLRALWVASRGPVDASFESWDVDAAWEKAAERMGIPSGRKVPVRVFSLYAKRRVTRPWISRVAAPALRAASILLLAGGAALTLYAASGRFGATGATHVVPDREYTTLRGQRAVINLVDGTRVILGPASTLRVPADYGRIAGDTTPFTSLSSVGPRTVAIEGEGYFDVAHDAKRAFAVRVGSQLVRDIGTKFVVRAYDLKRPVDVAVTEGVVLVADARLGQGDVGRLDATGAVSVQRGVDLRPYTSWTTGRLVFDDTPLIDALPTLERWYDLDITVVDGALYARRLFATFAEDEPASKVLELIALSLNVTVERNGRHVTLDSRRE
ncbi:MAG: DUF4974 domain-containing protein [Gemmatimonadaceae bacterium]|nr:DUF4974 domain-containing protein [Gemmatimonadaceae bacterium]